MCKSALLIVLAFALGFSAHWYFFSRGLERPVVGVTNTDSDSSLTKSLNNDEQATDFTQFWNTWAALETYFAPPQSSSTVPDSNEKVAAAIAGLVSSYNDPYTEFLPTEQAEQLKETVRGDFQGIGAVLNEIPGQGILVTNVITGSPAEIAGVRQGDVITAVNGNSVIEQAFADVVASIRGEAGTEVVLQVVREEGTIDINVTRGVVNIPTVASTVVSRLEEVGTRIKDGVSSAVSGISGLFEEEPVIEEQNYRLVRLTSFSGSSVEQLHQEIEAFAASDQRAFILDLRNNPGGDLAVATEIASHFLPEGEVVASVRNYQGEESFFRSSGDHTLGGKDGCVAIVVNGGSASAAEILAAALDEHDVARTVGERTFGKGSVQQLVEVGSLGTLKVTVAHWYTPLGVSISEQGFTPEFPVREDAEPTTGDPYLDTALDVCSE